MLRFWGMGHSMIRTVILMAFALNCLVLLPSTKVGPIARMSGNCRETQEDQQE
jgi:hypothetical protein